MAGLLTNKTVVLAKIESTYGTDPTPTGAANAVEIFDLTLRPVFDKIERKPLRASISPQAFRKGKKMWELTFTTELKNGGTAGTAGRLSPLFKSCGMSETVNAGTNVIYTPGTPTSSCTIYVYKDGLLYKITGARGTFEITVEAGKIPLIKWNFRGIFNLPTDTALASPTYETTIGVTAVSTATAVDGFSSGIIRSYSIDIANEVVERPSMNAASGTAGVIIGSRNPVGKLLMEAELEATEPFWTRWNADTAMNFTTTLGSVAGNIVTIAGTAKVQFDDLNPSDENGIFMYEMGLVFSGTDDEFTITLT